MNPVIRYMTTNDVDEVVIADRIVLGHSLGADTLINEIESNPFAHYFILEDEELSKLLGHVSLWIDSPNAQIINIYVLPPFQGKGYGKLLLDFAIDYVKSFQVEEFTLEVRPSNDKAIKLYEEHGFIQVAVRKNYYDNGEDAYLMLKRM